MSLPLRALVVGVGLRAFLLAAPLFVLFPLGVAVPAEYFAAAHVVVAVASTVGVIFERGVVGLIQRPTS